MFIISVSSFNTENKTQRDQIENNLKKPTNTCQAHMKKSCQDFFFFNCMSIQRLKINTALRYGNYKITTKHTVFIISYKGCLDLL